MVTFFFKAPYLATVIAKYIRFANSANQPVGFEFEDVFGIDLGKYLKNSGITTDSGPGQHFQYQGSLTTGGNMHNSYQKNIKGCNSFC